MRILKTLLSSDYGMLGVLVCLCVLFSLITYEEQEPTGKEGAEHLSNQIKKQFEKAGRIVIAGKGSQSGKEFSSFLSQKNSIDDDLVNSVKDIISSIRKNCDESLKSLSLKYDNHDVKNFLLTER